MAVDKLVDSTQLDADLTSVANAIRTKGGTSGQLAFPAGFVSAIEAISGGGGGGGNFVKHTGSFTPSSNILHFEVTGLGAPAMIVICVIHDWDTNALNNVSKHIGNLYADGASTIITTNGSGNSLAPRATNAMVSSWLNGRVVYDDGTIAAASGSALATKTGFTLPAWTGFNFKVGYTYDWICWTYPED